MKKKIFIAGGSGYVGCHLAKKLVNMGHFVRVLDLQLYGKNLEESENLELIKAFGVHTYYPELMWESINRHIKQA